MSGLLSAMLQSLKAVEAAWRPNPGPQSEFMLSPAFEVLYGGAAGGGKSVALVHDALRDVDKPHYRGLLLRRTFPELEKTLISISHIAYRTAHPGAAYNAQKRQWVFPSGARIDFGYLDRDDDVYQYQGAEYQYIGWDEVTHFSERQYTYLLSRARSAHGLTPRIRAATNPGGPGHEWVMRRWAPWLDAKSEVRAKPGELLHYRNTVESGEEWTPDGALSRVFIPARIADNPHIANVDPGYIERLRGLDPVTRAQLEDGDWLVQPAAGLYFRREWFTFVDSLPPPFAGVTVSRVRFWDKAATPPHDGNRDPDWTVGLKLAKVGEYYYVEDIERMRAGPGDVEKRILAVSQSDGQQCGIRMAQDPGSAGVSEAAAYVRLLSGYDIQTARETGDKVTRAKAVSAQASPQSTGGERGRIHILRGTWVDAFVRELESFPDGGHDDQVDALSGAFNALADGATQVYRPKKLYSNGGRWGGDTGRGFW
jgi:predicted phage terminase large subunit-like protein